MMQRLLITVFLFAFMDNQAQQNIGIPSIINYPKQTYGGGTQNWRIAQDEKHFVYFANNDGLISFDGTYWNIFYLPNKTNVRSVAVETHNRIYVGGQAELGYFSPGTAGALTYTDLKEKIPKEARNFDDVWEIVNLGDQTFFRVRNRILHLYGEKITFYETGNWRFLTSAAGTIYAQDLNNGLLRFEGGAFRPFLEGTDFKNEVIITGITPFAKDTLLIATLQHGLYLLAGNKAEPFIKGDIQKVIPGEITCIQVLPDGLIAVGTSNDGLFVINNKGIPIYHYNLESGLQNQNILSIASDKTGNIWLGLDNGIDYIAHNDPIKQIRPQGPNMGAGHTAIVHDGNFLLGTNTGLFKLPLINTEDLGLNPGPFSLVKGTKGQVWSLSEINNKLLMGHHLGAFVFQNETWVNKDYKSGYWNFIPLQNVFPASKIAGGTYRGLSFVDLAEKEWQQNGKTLPFESSRFLLKLNNDIWVSHPYKGIFKISPANNHPDSFSLEKMEERHGIKHINNNYIFLIKNTLIAATEDGILQYDESIEKFTPSPTLDSLIPFKNIRYIKEDPKGNLWIIYEKNLAVLDFEDKNPILISVPEFTNSLLNGFEFIYFFNQKNIILAAEKGFYLLDYEKYKKSKPDIKAHIRKVKVTDFIEQSVFSGYPDAENNVIPSTELKPGWKNIHIDFSAPSYGQQQIVEYSVQLKGYEDNWSPWSKRTDKEYTYLPPGDYTFMVRARDNLGHISEPATYGIIVLPPWYRTPWAYIGYTILFVSLFWGLHKYQQKTIRSTQQKYEEEQNQLKYLQQLEIDKAEKEMVKLRNEKLETELELQNAELASATMHLVQKAEIINGIKEELLKITKNYKSEISINELKKLIRTLGDDDAIDTGWDQFAQHFDKVHSNFHNTLKSKFPTLTSGEMKLCTYLRMNLSSKEISQLLHITPKSVELSRYRLRKKLGLTHDENLYDFLLKYSDD